MVVKKEYKKTEVGMVPEDWTLVSLGNHAQVRTGIAKNSSKKFSDPVRVHYLRVANVQDGYVDLTEMSEIDVERADLRRYSVLENDVLMNEGGDRDKLGRACIWLGQFDPCVHQNHVFVVRCYPKLCPSFLSSWTRSSVARNFFVNAGSQTTNLASINKTAISKLPIPLPPTLVEQEAIAGALSDADAWIESLEQLIAKKRQIKQGAMQELLTGKRRLPGFSGQWETKRLGEFLVSHPQYGINAAAVAYSDKLPVYIRITDITEYGQYAPNPRVCVQDSDVSGYFLADGDLVVARTGASVGKSYRYRITDGPLVFAGFLIRIRPNAQQLNPRFLEGYVAGEKYWNWVRLMSMRSGQPGINGNEYAQLPIELPSIAEQTAIATVLSDMDTEIESHESKLAKAREIKQGMMQELLTGKIRLVKSSAISANPQEMSHDR